METNTKIDKRDWTPVRVGNIYCSPACGAKCTHDAYLRATTSAEKLKERCEKEIGGEWSVRVHENLGWHWSVYHNKTKFEIYVPMKSDNYAIGLLGGTPIQISLHPDTFASPKEAWDKLIKNISDEAEKWNTILSNAK
jgi:hypothetical protein